MPIVSGKYVAPSWHNGTSPAVNASELTAMSETLEMVPVENGGTGTNGVSSVDTVGDWRFRKWGKVVFAQYISSSKIYTDNGSAGTIPPEYCPVGNVHFACCGFNTSGTLDSDPITYAKIQVRANGSYDVSTYDYIQGYVRGTTCWLIA